MQCRFFDSKLILEHPENRREPVEPKTKSQLFANRFITGFENLSCGADPDPSHNLHSGLSWKYSRLSGPISMPFGRSFPKYYLGSSPTSLI